MLRVNDRIITLFDYRERLAERQRAIRKAELPPDQLLKELAAAPNAVLREMMDEILLLSRGDQLGSDVSQSRIDEAVTATRKNMGLEDDEQWQLALQQYGMSEAAFRARTRDNLLFQEVLGREVRGKIKVNDEDLQRYYREHAKEFETPAQTKLREIVVLEGAGRSAEELATFAAGLRQQLEGGKKLDEVAALYAPEKRTSGVNDLGTVKTGELDKKLEDALVDVPINGFSQPVSARGGLHILQVLERVAAKIRPYSEVQAELEAAERSRRFQAELASYMQELEKDAYLQASPPPEAANFRGTRPREPEAGISDLAPSAPAASPATGPTTPAVPPTTDKVAPPPPPPAPF